MEILFKVRVGQILEASAQMRDGTLDVWRESYEEVGVKGPAKNILSRYNRLGKVGIEPVSLTVTIGEEDLPNEV